METVNSNEEEQINVRACLVGERINTKLLEKTPPPVALAPLVIRAGIEGYAVLFRFGAVVMFNLSEKEEDAFLESLVPLVSQQLPTVFEEFNNIIVDSATDDHITNTGIINIKEMTVERMQVIAEVLSDALILDYYEGYISSLFDKLEPLAEHLKNEGKCGAHEKTLTKLIGEILLTLVKTGGRIEVDEKPDVLWDMPDLERLYSRLSEEYEIKNRNNVLNHKLDLASKTIETLLNLDQHNHSAKLEWYVIILIILEIVAIMYH
ncbi:MAG: RMD1 family protein [Alphaproteobacteria bacterium]